MAELSKGQVAERVLAAVGFVALVVGLTAWALAGWWGWGLIGFVTLIVCGIVAAFIPGSGNLSGRDDDEGPGNGVAP